MVSIVHCIYIIDKWTLVNVPYTYTNKHFLNQKVSKGPDYLLQGAVHKLCHPLQCEGNLAKGDITP